MTNRLCLSKESYFQMIQCEFFGIDYDEEFADLKGWIEQSKDYYDIELVGFNYFLSKNLEIYVKKGIDCDKLLAFVYSFNEKLIFTIQEFDYQFIENLMNQMPDANNTLDEDLIKSIEMY